MYGLKNFELPLHIELIVCNGIFISYRRNIIKNINSPKQVTYRRRNSQFMKTVYEPSEQQYNKKVNHQVYRQRQQEILNAFPAGNTRCGVRKRKSI
ncbi:MAG: hypothetical protein K0R82_1605 [Flavipsychrobacter sp.]|nr:hypothetical protein [Flavipsychrobacter sp.]